MKKKIIILLLPAAILLQGCVAFVASQLGYMEAKTKYSKLYDDYKSEKETENIEREKDGLDQEQVLEFNDWLKIQPLTSNEIKVFKYRGVISAEDARGIREREAMAEADG